MPVGKVRLFSDRPAARPDPLEHWLEQERDARRADELNGTGETPAAMPSGWWILPAVLLALPLWGVLIWAALAG